MKNTVKVENTRFPRLTRAILRRLSREELKDVASHGAYAGWSGFTYYTDTNAFYKAHKADILALAKQVADESYIGCGMLGMVQEFRCLRGAPINGTRPQRHEQYSLDEIAAALHSDKGEASPYIRNAMAWFALEEVARELNPDI